MGKLVEFEELDILYVGEPISRDEEIELPDYDDDGGYCDEV